MNGRESVSSRCEAWIIFKWTAGRISKGKSFRASRKRGSKPASGKTAGCGTAGRYISERDASRVAEAFDLLAPHGASIVGAAQHYAKYLEGEKTRRASKIVSESLTLWLANYESKDGASATVQEIKSKAGIFAAAFGDCRLAEFIPGRLTEWFERYESAPGVIASPQTRANLRTKLSQFFGFAKLQGWIESNPLEEVKLGKCPKRRLPSST